MLQLLYAGTTSACFEWVNDNPYYAPEPYTVYLNGTRIFGAETNVFSLFDLIPDTAYVVTAKTDFMQEEVSFQTKKETCVINVRAFGAKGDGITEDTASIQAALSFLPEGGRLYFPEGTYLTLPLALRSHITLEFAQGAVLLGSTDRERYPILPGEVADSRDYVDDLSGTDSGRFLFGTFEGDAKPMYQALLTAQYASDITITGQGCVDGNAQNSDFWKDFEAFPAARPRLFFFNHCQNITIHGIHACNSASWQFHPFFSSQLAFYDISITAPANSPNTDALDPEFCDHVDIIGCHFSVGDDCIAIKSGKIDLGRRFRKPADQITIRNCLMESGHGAITLGSEIGAGVEELTVSHCLFRKTDRGLRIKARRGRGKDCQVDGVLFENIRMEGVKTPFVINMWYNCCDPDRFSEYVYSRDHLPVDDRTPHFGKFSFHDIECIDAEVAACYIDGLPEMPIDEVRFKNVKISFFEDAKPGIPAMQNFAEARCRLGFYFDNVRHVDMDNVTLCGVEGKKLIADHCESITTKDFTS